MIGTNLFLLAVLAMIGAWTLYFHIQDKKEEKRKQREAK
jgi:hypothetical protein